MRTLILVDNSSNKYQEDTRAWHALIDIRQVCKLLEPVTIDTLNRIFDTSPDYYDDVLDELQEDGYIVLK